MSRTFIISATALRFSNRTRKTAVPNPCLVALGDLSRFVADTTLWGIADLNFDVIHPMQSRQFTPTAYDLPADGRFEA